MYIIDSSGGTITNTYNAYWVNGLNDDTKRTLQATDTQVGSQLFDILEVKGSFGGWSEVGSAKYSNQLGTSGTNGKHTWTSVTTDKTYRLYLRKTMASTSYYVKNNISVGY